MPVFLDESFRQSKTTGRAFGVLAGVAIPEDVFHAFQHDFFSVRRPYHGTVLGENDEIKGSELLCKATLKRIAAHGSPPQWSLAEDLLGFARSRRIKVFGVVCFRPGLQSIGGQPQTSLKVMRERPGTPWRSA